MAEPSTYHNYSFEDIQRYLQGKMSATEMHAIEKAALQDPFLADAIEGFNEADLVTAKQHLNEINAGIFAEKRKSKVVGFNKRMQWLNVAAVVIVLAGIGVVASYFIRSSTSNKSTEVAQLKNKPVKNEPAQDSLSATANTNDLAKKRDTPLLIAQNKAAKKVRPSFSERKEQGTALKDHDPEIAGVSAAAPQLDYDVKSSITDTVNHIPTANKPFSPEQTMTARAQAVADTPSQLQGKVSGLSVSPFTFSGKVVDEDNYPVPFAVIETDDTGKNLVADANGDFILYKKDSLINVTVSSLNYNSRNVALRQGINNPIILKRSNASVALNEVVITASAKKTRSDSSMPVGGWKNFNNYVLTRLNTDTTAGAATSAEDLVELEFLVDKSGSPYNITVIKSLDKQRNAKAIDILKNGPKWTIPTGKQKAKVTINF